MNYTAQSQAISDQQQQARVAQAAVKTALAVLSEAGATAGHAERAAYSYTVLNAPMLAAADLVYAVAANPNCGSGASDPLTEDDALEFVLASVWNAFSNYSPAA